MTWTVSYSYGSICSSESFDDEDEAQAFYAMIEERLSEFDDYEGSEYEPLVSISKDEEENYDE